MLPDRRDFALFQSGTLVSYPDRFRDKSSSGEQKRMLNEMRELRRKRNEEKKQNEENG